MARPVGRLRYGGVLLVLATLACATDPRPVIENGSSRTLRLRSTHLDGQSLGVVLHPGAKIWLGMSGSPIRDIAWERDEAPIGLPSIERTAIESCLAASRSTCTGWRVIDAGIEKLPDAAAR